MAIYCRSNIQCYRCTVTLIFTNIKYSKYTVILNMAIKQKHNIGRLKVSCRYVSVSYMLYQFSIVLVTKKSYLNFQII